MLRCRKWILTLGIAAAVPGITMAGLPSLFKSNKQAKPAAAAGRKTATKTKNQQVAEDVAGALRAAKLKGYDIGIEYKNGVATLTGMITDAGQKAKASKVASRIPGVRMVDNRLKMIGQPTSGTAARPAAPGLRAASRRAPIRLAAYSDGGRRRPSGILQIGGETLNPASEQPSFITQTDGVFEAAGTQDNQAVAERLGSALSSADLTGYDIEIQYQNGTATLNGAVGTPEQRARATQVAQQVAGVQLVDNRLQVAGQPQFAGQPQGNPFATASYQPVPPAGVPGASGSGMPGPPSYGHPGQGASHAVYNMPNLPEHSWPSYASYPNYSQVTYPSQYSASAWPYIGPFYPYPQVPMGWRKATLEWDDGYWNLSFNSKTDKWWWFLNPKHW